MPGPGASAPEFIGRVSPRPVLADRAGPGTPRPSVGWSLVLVLALDTSTPTVTAGVVRLRQPHELLDPDPTAEAGSPAAAATLPAPADHRAGRAHRHRPVRARGTADAAGPGGAGRLPSTGCPTWTRSWWGSDPARSPGLRVGIATAAALGDALDIPVHGVPSHDALARCVGPLTGRPAGGHRRPAPRGLPVRLPSRRSPAVRTAGRPAGRGAGAARRARDDAGAAGRAGGAAAGRHRRCGRHTSGAMPADPLSGGLVERAAVALLTGAVPGPLTPLYLRRPDATEPGARRSVLGR